MLGLAWAALAPAGTPARAQEAPPAATNLWFDVGEELIYQVYWGVIHAGETRVTTEWVEHEGRTVLAIRFRTKGNKFIEKIYPVDDFIESLVDPATFLPIRFTKILNEGRHHSDEVTTFDFQNLTARWVNRAKGREKVFAIEPNTRDIVTFMYYLRSRELEPGDEYQYRVMADEKLYDLYLKVGSLDTMKFERFGKVKSVRVEPEAAFQGIFVRKGKLTMWVSKDPRRVCTRMMASIPVANIRVNLDKVRGPGDDFWVRSSGSRVDASAAEAAAPEVEAPYASVGSRAGTGIGHVD